MHVPISKSELLQLNDDNVGDKQPLVILTSLGRTIVEIQGDLKLPINNSPEDHPDAELRFGLLDIEENHDDPVMSRVTLYVGQKQRLLGKVVSLDVPLGLLNFNKGDNKVTLQDIIRYKILFQDRPLPIM
ncbi:chromosome transmission fidelity protein 8 [Monosporozyma servazzii]